MTRADRIRAYLRKSVALLDSGQLTYSDFKAIIARAETLLRLADRHRWLHDTRCNARRHLDLFTKARAILASRGRIVAIDTGFKADGAKIIEELGVSTWNDGVIETATYRILERAGRPMEALYGPIHYVGQSELLPLAHAAYKSADIAIFHSSASDLDILQLPRDISHIDLPTLYRVFREKDRSLSLLNMCAAFCPDIDITHPHDSGNDAYRTLQVLIGLISSYDDEERYWGHFLKRLYKRARKARTPSKKERRKQELILERRASLRRYYAKRQGST